MNKLSTADKIMIAEGAEFKVGKTYFKHEEGILLYSIPPVKEWSKAYKSESETKYKLLPSSYKDLRQRIETPSQQEISPNQGDCIASEVHLMCVELQLMYSYLPVTEEFIVDYSDMTFKLKTFDDIGKLRHMVTLIEELSYEE